MAYVGRPGATAPLTTADIPDGSITAAKVTADVATQAEIDLKANIASPTFTGTPAVPTASAATNTTQAASTAYVRTEVSNLVDSAPGALDTLNELAAALGDDANFSTTVTNSIATKLPLAGGTMTGNIVMGDDTSIGIGDSAERIEFDGAGDISVLGANLGIGTATPADIIDIQKNQNATTSFYLRNTDTTDTSSRAYLNIESGNRTLQIGTINSDHAYINAPSGANLYFQDGGANNMVIDSSGHVAIGQTTGYPMLAPTANSASFCAYGFVGDQNTGMYRSAADTLNFATGGTDRMYIAPTGGVSMTSTLGIGISGMGDVALIQSWNSSAGGSTLSTRNYLCGSDKDRVGFYWQNSGVLNVRMWLANDGDLRWSGGTPGSEGAGSAVGSQSFSATHVYKTDETDLKIMEAVKLVNKKLVRCTTPKDPACIGIYLGESGRIVDSFGESCTYTYDDDDDEETPPATVNPDAGTAHAVVSLGDTIHNINELRTTGFLVDCDVEAGDLLCTGTTAGKLTKQDDDVIHSYTVGKAGEDGNASAPVYGYIYCG